VPNPAVDMNSWAGSACYPQGSFCPLRHGPSTRYRGITTASFRPCAACLPCSQAPLCRCTRPWVAIPREGTIARLRYILGGDRPSQTTHQPPSPRMAGEGQHAGRVVFHRRLRHPREGTLSASHLSYASTALPRWQAVVKLHGVFLSCCGLTASSPSLQFHRAPR
jgi:hypothetical protein